MRLLWMSWWCGSWVAWLVQKQILARSKRRMEGVMRMGVMIAMVHRRWCHIYRKRSPSEYYGSCPNVRDIHLGMWWHNTPSHWAPWETWVSVVSLGSVCGHKVAECCGKGHSTMNVRERGTLEMLVFHLNPCPDIDSTLAGVFNIYSICIIVKLCKRTGPFWALFKWNTNLKFTYQIWSILLVFGHRMGPK